MSSSSQYIDELKNVYTLIDINIKSSEEKIQFQHRIYTELYRIFLKHANKLATLANSINEEVLEAVNQEELVVQYYQMLSNSLLRLADCSRRVSLRFKSEVLDPLKTFNENYENLYEDVRKKVDSKIGAVITQDQEASRQRDNYNNACEKFEKHRDMQKKIIEKIENGNKNELEKFNQNTKKLTENITSSEKYYLSSVAKLNQEWESLRKEFTNVNQSISYNEDARIVFFKKTVINSIKTFEEFNGVYDPEMIRKIDAASKSNGMKTEETGQKKMRILLDRIINNDFREEFVSYDDMMKNKRKKGTEEESSHLNQYFSKIKDKEKRLMLEIINPWFINSNKKIPQAYAEENVEQEEQRHLHKVKSMSVMSANSRQKVNKDKSIDKSTKEIELCKERIVEVPVQSLFFVEHLYQKINDMSSFYCKVNEDNFQFLLEAFQTITKKLDPNSDVGIEIIFKMMHISQRIMLRKQIFSKHGSSHPIQLLCQRYGKTTPKFRDPKVISALLNHIQKRKTIKKKNSDSKGSLNSIAKGFFAALTTKRLPLLSDEQQYNCLQQLITLVANFSVPNQVILPFIKQTLGNSHQGSYDYLKGIILNKKDVEERQSLFFKKQIKENKEMLLVKAMEEKKIGEYAIMLVAQHGFLGRQELKLRIVSRGLKDIHLDILARLKISTNMKWIRLIPVDQKLNYIQMKQEVAQNSVPSSIQQIITLDVNRSLHMHGESLNPTILHSLLRIYAYFHPDISYCQGMNYIAGYLYIKTMNEQYTYRIFEYLMKVRFQQIFVNEFEVLKVKMYQFQRLLSIYHPEISEHFKRQAISPECYIVSWIITLFASSYQYTMGSYLIDFLWERFIIWGWPEFFRFVLWIFSLFKEDLVELTYDKALHFLGELGRSEMFLSNEQKFKSKYSATIEDPKLGIERYQVSQQLLNKFTQEYSLDQ